MPLFKGIQDSSAKQVAAAMVEQVYRPGQILFSQGDPDKAFYLVLSGELEVLVVDNHSSFHLKIGSKCFLTKPTRIDEKTYPSKTAGTIDKFDPKRNYPYTFKVDSDGSRGRVSESELAPQEGLEMKTLALLRAGDYCGEQALIK